MGAHRVTQETEGSSFDEFIRVSSELSQLRSVVSRREQELRAAEAELSCLLEAVELGAEGQAAPLGADDAELMAMVARVERERSDADATKTRKRSTTPRAPSARPAPPVGVTMSGLEPERLERSSAPQSSVPSSALQPPSGVFPVARGASARVERAFQQHVEVEDDEVDSQVTNPELLLAIMDGPSSIGTAAAGPGSSPASALPVSAVEPSLGQQGVPASLPSTSLLSSPVSSPSLEEGAVSSSPVSLRQGEVAVKTRVGVVIRRPPAA